MSQTAASRGNGSRERSRGKAPRIPALVAFRSNAVLDAAAGHSFQAKLRNLAGTDGCRFLIREAARVGLRATTRISAAPNPLKAKIAARAAPPAPSSVTVLPFNASRPS